MACAPDICTVIYRNTYNGCFVTVVHSPSVQFHKLNNQWHSLVNKQSCLLVTWHCSVSVSLMSNKCDDRISICLQARLQMRKSDAASSNRQSWASFEGTQWEPGLLHLVWCPKPPQLLRILLEIRHLWQNIVCRGQAFPWSCPFLSFLHHSQIFKIHFPHVGSFWSNSLGRMNGFLLNIKMWGHFWCVCLSVLLILHRKWFEDLASIAPPYWHIAKHHGRYCPL